MLGGYASSTTGLSVDPANVLNWWTATPGFAAPPPAAAPRPTAALSVNGTRGAETLLVKARSDGPAVVDLDGSGSHDSKGSPLVFTWTVTQTEPVVKEVEVLVGLVQPPRLLQRCVLHACMLGHTEQALLGKRIGALPTTRRVLMLPPLTLLILPLLVRQTLCLQSGPWGVFGQPGRLRPWGYQQQAGAADSRSQQPANSHTRRALHSNRWQTRGG